MNSQDFFAEMPGGPLKKLLFVAECLRDLHPAHGWAIWKAPMGLGFLLSDFARWRQAFFGRFSQF